MANCCPADCNHKKGFWSGIIYGLIPHTFCIAFFVLSLVGAAAGAALAKKFLLIPHFFLLLAILSLLCATLAAFLYLKNNQCCSVRGLKKKSKYIASLYAVTIITNILVAYVIFPALANGPEKAINNPNQLSVARIEVQLPCPGHAPLITDEVKKISGVETVTFNSPRAFEITYDPQEVSLDDIKASEIFKTFKIRTN